MSLSGCGQTDTIMRRDIFHMSLNYLVFMLLKQNITKYSLKLI
ncbi:hypothetical protein HMPREF1485_00097 [Propionibacterium sp. HGH0353]|nr:hypothetical protein HMPREF1485_00097 [Propionibacterium sp. HGH0353]